ncbi:MAG: hypothetical protein EHM41_21985 [Chloroflexi bacterium]|nr:MAG: hypothetical protein EHM41_21985 [Chloroflexota bacterium]
MNIVILVLIVSAVILLALLGALFVIGLAIYRARTKANGKQPGKMDEVNAQQADEITATWTLLNH